MTGPADSTLTGPVGGDASAGALLRRAREKQGTHIAALAAAIKVAPRKLELLEADRFDELPDPSFTRALAQAVCRALKIDPAPVLALLPQAGDRPLDAVGKGINTPFRERSTRMPGGSDRPIWQRAGFWLPIVVIVIAAALYFMPSRLISTLSMPGGAASAAAPAASAARVVTEPVAPVPAASAPLVTTSPPAPPPAAVPAATTAADVATPPPSTLQVRTSQPSWIEVQDSAGRLLISRVVEPGEPVDLDGTLPLKLRVGNALATQVIFRGQPVELARHTRENIARLELK